jgi:5-formyltetrahydrofolate cyclo-ligase
VDKKQARAEIRRRLRALSAEEKARKSKTICERVTQLPEFRDAKVVMLFASMPDEVDTSLLFARAFADGKRVVAPKCLTGHRRILPILLRSGADLAPGAYGIMEPTGSQSIPVEEIDFVLVPGYGFDRAGNRLGKGAGYYDKFMSQPGFRATRCAIAFSAQLLDQVPHDEHDLPVQILVTEDRLLRFS